MTTVREAFSSEVKIHWSTVSTVTLFYYSSPLWNFGAFFHSIIKMIFKVPPTLLVNNSAREMEERRECGGCYFIQKLFVSCYQLGAECRNFKSTFKIILYEVERRAKGRFLLLSVADVRRSEEVAEPLWCLLLCLLWAFKELYALLESIEVLSSLKDKAVTGICTENWWKLEIRCEQRCTITLSCVKNE